MTGRLGNSPMVHGLTVVPGETYKVSLWATIGGATSSVNVTTSLNCADGTGPGTTWMGGSQTVEDGTWVEFTGELQIPDCQLGWTALWLEGPGAGVDLYLDHISVRPVVSQNLVQNDTFESGTAGWFTWSGGELSARLFP